MKRRQWWLAEGLDRFSQDTTVEVTRIEASWARLRTYAPDRLPVVGSDPEIGGFFWFAGQRGFGIQTARALADLATARLQPCLGTASFGRFSGREILGPLHRRHRHRARAQEGGGSVGKMLLADGRMF